MTGSAVLENVPVWERLSRTQAVLAVVRQCVARTGYPVLLREVKDAYAPVAVLRGDPWHDAMGSQLSSVLAWLVRRGCLVRTGRIGESRYAPPDVEGLGAPPPRAADYVVDALRIACERAGTMVPTSAVTRVMREQGWPCPAGKGKGVTTRLQHLASLSSRSGRRLRNEPPVRLAWRTAADGVRRRYWAPADRAELPLPAPGALSAAEAVRRLVRRASRYVGRPVSVLEANAYAQALSRSNPLRRALEGQFGCPTPREARLARRHGATESGPPLGDGVRSGAPDHEIRPLPSRESPPGRTRWVVPVQRVARANPPTGTRPRVRELRTPYTVRGGAPLRVWFGKADDAPPSQGALIAWLDDAVSTWRVGEELQAIRRLRLDLRGADLHALGPWLDGREALARAVRADLRAACARRRGGIKAVLAAGQACDDRVRRLLARLPGGVFAKPRLARALSAREGHRTLLLDGADGEHALPSAAAPQVGRSQSLVGPMTSVGRRDMVVGRSATLLLTEFRRRYEGHADPERPGVLERMLRDARRFPAEISCQPDAAFAREIPHRALDERPGARRLDVRLDAAEALAVFGGAALDDWTMLALTEAYDLLGDTLRDVALLSTCAATALQAGAAPDLCRHLVLAMAMLQDPSAEAQAVRLLSSASGRHEVAESVRCALLVAALAPDGNASAALVRLSPHVPQSWQGWLEVAQQRAQDGVPLTAGAEV